MTLAHVKWFVPDPDRFSVDWGRLLAWPTLAGIGAGILGIAVAAWITRRVDEDRVTGWARRLLRPYLPLILSVHLGISLAVYAATGRYLAPSIRLPDGAAGTALAAIELAVAVLIVSGLFTRYAAALLVVSGPVGMAFYGFLPILERVELLGIALYLAAVGRRRWSVDALIRRHRDPGGPLNPAGVAMLRLCAGLAVVVTALTEKLLAPETSEAFLARFPEFNFLSGAGVSDRLFVDVVGAIEIALGLVLLSGVGTRLAVLVAVVPFNLTLIFLGLDELIGHLPIYGIFLVLLVEGGGRLRALRRVPEVLDATTGTGGRSTSPGSTA